VETLAVNSVHGIEVGLVHELDLGLDDLVERRACRLQDRLEVVDRLIELGRETALDEVPGLRVPADLSGDIDKAPMLARVNVGASRLVGALDGERSG